MARILYLRVSTEDQTVDAQRHALQGPFDKEFLDEGVSGAVLAADRPGFSALLQYVREGDTVCVYSVDRLGRDAIDIQATVRSLLQRGIGVEVHGLGRIAAGVGELVLAVLAQIASMERARIKERTAAGREVARKALEATGRTHRGKQSLGRPMKAQPEAVAAWKQAEGKSISETAAHFGLSTATVKRYCSATARRLFAAN